jgi:uncharacterized damage-inducible protein DinB
VPAVPDALLDFKPHEKTNPIRTILIHQLLFERRFFAQFVGTDEPPVEELLPAGEKPVVQAYIDKYIWLVKRRLPQLAKGTAAWWLEQRPFFGGLWRERIWVFWRRVLHTCHHRTQVQTWLRLGGHEPVAAIYGPSGDAKWDEADPTYALEAAKRGWTRARSGLAWTRCKSHQPCPPARMAIPGARIERHQPLSASWHPAAP